MFHFERRGGNVGVGVADAKSRHSSRVEIRSLDLRPTQEEGKDEEVAVLVDEKENRGDPRKVEVDSSEGDASISVAAVTFSLTDVGCAGVESDDGGLRGGSKENDTVSLSSDSECSSVEDVVIDMSKLGLTEMEDRVLQPLEKERKRSIAKSNAIANVKDKAVQARFAVRETPQSIALQLASDTYAMRIGDEAIRAFLGSARIGRNGIDGVAIAKSRLRHAARNKKEKDKRSRSGRGIRSRLGAVTTPAAPFGSKA